MSPATKFSLRKTPLHLLAAYRYGEAAGGLVGRDLRLEVEGSVFTLGIDLSGNLLARNKASARYRESVRLAAQPHALKSLQCPDNLTRTRLARNWSTVPEPRMRLLLDLSPRGRYLYEVVPHALFSGGVQLMVQAYLGDALGAPPASGADAR